MDREWWWSVVVVRVEASESKDGLDSADIFMLLFLIRIAPWFVNKSRMLALFTVDFLFFMPVRFVPYPIIP